MSEQNPLGDVAKVFTNLDDTALQSLFDQANAELTLRRTTRAFNIFTGLMEANILAGNKEKDKSTCQALRKPNGQLIGVQINIPFDVQWSISENLSVWVSPLTALETNSTAFDFQIQGSSSEKRHALVSFKVHGLQTMPGLLEAEDSSRLPSLSMVLKAYEYLQEEVEPLRASEPVSDEQEVRPNEDLPEED